MKSDYYAILNSDVEVASNWIEPIIELMESDANIAACQPKLINYQDRKSFEYAGASGGWIDSFGYPFREEGFLISVKRMRVNIMM